MFRSAVHAFRWCLVWMILGVGVGNAQTNRPPPPGGGVDLYVLVVGSGEYSGSNGLHDLESAEVSAGLVAEALRGIATHVVLLTSRLTEPGRPSGHAVTRGDIRRALVELKARIREDAARAPRILVYMMGHGFGDPDLDVLFFIPGDFQGDLTQVDGLSVIHSTLWNVDLIGAVVTFRTHASMRGWDPLLLPGDAMPDLNAPFESLSRLRDTQALIAQAERLGAGAPPEGNPPVPYVLLFDNCAFSIEDNPVIDARILLPFMQQSFRELVDEGLAYYATEPGTAVTDVPLPDSLPGDARPSDFENPHMGPLGRRLLEILAERTGHSTLADLQRQIELARPEYGNIRFDGRPWAPFSHGGAVVADTRRAELIPSASPRRQTRIERRFGTGLTSPQQ